MFTKTTGKVRVSAEMLSGDSSKWNMWVRYQRQFVFAGVRIWRTVDEQRRSFPRYSMSHLRDGFVDEIREARLSYNW